ncbi:hypothetical protein CcaverHIS002_0601170 [Cutaneotrichosporon cavernicola]|uniref:Ribosomal RNA-processing protein 43 n=1 Tax=Cutaneotrichosporon cavernicola TaxID=279322 RepID=A0AA48L5S3_9TREE|nr:uncharacterized protein CcaverHIS019_0501270 [Cutaneotrichosporon cavernicola]BEI85830.1 hypothetical protein CcaverHIS002_0601170 [Cutaneotrichosporon cavernicola]BEI92499.1 hypothetical protein CcaverHIS019_0501270 [Cutaneotrichosporon cavernicola]BEJ00271.1 hypothetical protein CcaverHIS631_0501280 [Cutaneotrichosporon cavernicola]BEJ08041.1 hypothetical protein CcaverHIS641_0501260 [Cutaneotrichosporon cavernicola]
MSTAVQAPASADFAGSSSAAAVFQRLHPDQYLTRFLDRGYRPDGRRKDAWREVSVNVGSISTANGSALVRMGDTTVVCGVKAEVAEPCGSRPDEGFVVPNIDLPALCSPKFKPGPPADEAQTMSNWLNDLIVSSCTLPPTSLVIAPGKAAWSVYIDVVCINFDGNAYDAAVLAVMAALRNTRLPRATYSEDNQQVTCDASVTFPLPLGRLPLAASFGVFQSTHVLPDPSAFELPLHSTTITIALDEAGNACTVRQEGLGGVIGQSGDDVLSEAWAAAEARVRTLRTVLEQSS